MWWDMFHSDVMMGQCIRESVIAHGLWVHATNVFRDDKWNPNELGSDWSASPITTSYNGEVDSDDGLITGRISVFPQIMRQRARVVAR